MLVLMFTILKRYRYRYDTQSIGYADVLTPPPTPPEFMRQIFEECVFPLELYSLFSTRSLDSATPTRIRDA